MKKIKEKGGRKEKGRRKEEKGRKRRKRKRERDEAQTLVKPQGPDRTGAEDNKQLLPVTSA